MVHGTIFWGKVQSVGTQCIKTEVALFGLPLFPIRSIQVVSRDGDTYLAHPIPLHLGSVLAFYFRMYGWLPALLIFVLNPVARANPDTGWIVTTLGDIAFFGWIALAFFLTSRSWGVRKRQQKVLGKVTGICALPKVLFPDARKKIETSLVYRIRQLGFKDDPVALSAKSPAPDLAPLLYTRALYGETINPGRGWKELAFAAWPAAEQFIQANQYKHPPLGPSPTTIERS